MNRYIGNGVWSWGKTGSWTRYLVFYGGRGWEYGFVELLQFAVVDDFGNLVRVGS